MKSTAFALAAFVAQAMTAPFADAFVPSVRFGSVQTTTIARGNGMTTVTTASTSSVMRSSVFSLNASRYADDDDEDEDDDDDDDDDDDYEMAGKSAASLSSSAGTKSPFTGLKLDPYDPNPVIKPRPSRYFKEPVDGPERVPDDQLVQTMSADERKENLSVMRQIRKSDLPDLRMRKDYAGWVEANNELKRRVASDPWFDVNERLRDAIQLGADEGKVKALQALAEKVGGPPPGLTVSKSRGYIDHTEIYDIGISAGRAAAVLEREIRAERVARGRAMMAERRKNMEKAQQQFEEDMRNPGLREDREAKERRERTMRRIMGEIEEDKKKREERAKDILGKVPDAPDDRMTSMEKALDEARSEVKDLRRKLLGKEGEGSIGGGAGTLGFADDEDDDDDVAGGGTAEKSGADKAREAAAAEASGGRPRLPGDPDVTQGEVENTAASSSITTTGPLQVQVTSTYNKEASDPPMRKHCFQYTIRITNNSPTDTIQLLGRRFEIQTVGASMKDVVEGEGVTGRTPVLKPGEVFEYTSTAPLSVRPLGTTIIAARMRGEYRYAVLGAQQETATPEQLKEGGQSSAELGAFHFVFPEDQRVQPFRAEDEDDEEEEDDDDIDDTPVTAAAATPAAAKPATTPSASPPSKLPGDRDITEGSITVPLNDSSDVVTEDVKVQASTSYRPERSDAMMDKHSFAYNIRITNQSKQPIQLVSRKFEIQTIGSQTKDVIQGPGVTGRQPILKPGESFEYTSTAPLNVKPLLEKTPVVARMQGEYNFVVLADDSTTPMSSEPLQAKLGMFHFILPSLV